LRVGGSTQEGLVGLPMMRGGQSMRRTRRARKHSGTVGDRVEDSAASLGAAAYENGTKDPCLAYLIARSSVDLHQLSLAAQKYHCADKLRQNLLEKPCIRGYSSHRPATRGTSASSRSR